MSLFLALVVIADATDWFDRHAPYGMVEDRDGTAWIRLTEAESGDGQFVLASDLQRVAASGSDARTVWMMSRETKNRIFVETKQRVEMQCQYGTMRIIYRVSFDRAGKVLATSPFPQNHQVVPGTVGAMWRRAICAPD